MKYISGFELCQEMFVGGVEETVNNMLEHYNITKYGFTILTFK